MVDSSTEMYRGNEPPRLPDLDLVRPIGSGGFGQVWLATNRITRQVLAVKLVRLHSADAADRAAREVVSLIRYHESVRERHENLLPILHVGQTDDLLYYTMEPADDVSGRPASLDPAYCPATLAAKLARAPVPPRDCADYARQLLGGLACLHRAGLVHRDVKPSNCVFVGGHLKLADFGLLKEADSTLSHVGTLRYMPPDGRMDARADVYAAGLTIYVMYSGLPPEAFPRWSSAALEQRHHPTLRIMNQLALRACQADPDKRFGDAEVMLAALEQATAWTPRRPRPRRLVLGLLAACVAVALAGGALLLRPGTIRRVDMDFITVPFEADIYLDGKRALDPQGEPYTTPCTIPDLPARQHRVVFRKDGLPDLVVGTVDFSRQREVEARWKAGGGP